MNFNNILLKTQYFIIYNQNTHTYAYTTANHLHNKWAIPHKRNSIRNRIIEVNLPFIKKITISKF